MSVFATENISFVVAKVDHEVHGFGAVCMSINFQSVIFDVAIRPKRACRPNDGFELIQKLRGGGFLEIYTGKNVVFHVPIGEGLNYAYSYERVGSGPDMGCKWLTHSKLRH